jgi:hypothetical protein
MGNIRKDLKAVTIRVMRILNLKDPLKLIEKLDSAKRDEVIFEFTKQMLRPENKHFTKKSFKTVI